MESQNNNEKEEAKGGMNGDDRVKEVHHHHHYTHKGNSGASWFFGLFFILAGFMFLAKNLGLIPSTINLYRLWPLFIIFIGLSMLKARGIASFLAAIFVIIVVFGMVAMSMFYSAFRNTSGTRINDGTNGRQFEMYLER